MSEAEPQLSALSNVSSLPTASDDDEVLAALADDFAAHLRRGEEPPLAEYIERHPALAERIGKVFQAVALMEQTRTVDFTAEGERPGDTIGRYRLLEQIGEGGFGVVFMAEQQEPVRRKVALKVIKPGMDTKQVIARFEAERQALAVMDHSNIARVLDAGATPSGRPYFVMELVRGVPITTYCDDRNLPVPARLELFATVCRAVQHAHTKGIIHRDIKPSNVLVTRQDGRPTVKVIDFGIAKAMDRQLTEKTLFTNFAQMIGTPLYMSPEQAEQSSVDIDTRSDIYSLGVLLYELLTGSTPVDAAQLKRAAFDEIRRIIRELEPQKPSARISGSHTLPAIAAHRHMEPDQLSKLVRGELDWIVMKALEKDRTRRYETVIGLARDVERYLKDEPVEACPPSAWYRFRKFAQRNKAALGMASGTALLVLAAAGILAVSNLRVSEALERERLNSYSQRIALANREFAANNLQRMEEVLDECPEDLWGWEWHYLKRLRYSTLRPLRHDSPVLSAAFSPDGQYLATATQAGVLRLWETKTGQLYRQWSAHRQLADSVAFSPPDGRYLASGSMDGSVKVWEMKKILQGETDQPLFQVEHDFRVWSVTFSPDGRLLASGAGKATSAAGEVQVWDVGSRTEVRSLRLSNKVSCVQFSPDGMRLAALTVDSLRIWDLQSGQEQVFISDPLEALQSTAFSPDGDSVAMVGGLISVHPDRDVTIWNAHNGTAIRRLPGHVGGLRTVAFSPDGSRLASAGLDQNVRLWDTSTGQEILTLRGHLDNIWCVTFSADGYQLASASVDNTVRIWDATPLESKPTPEYVTLRGHRGAVTDVAFHPADGRRLISAGTDGTVREWDARSGKQLGVLDIPPSINPVRVACSPDGKRLAVASDIQDGAAVRIWDIATEMENLLLRGNIAQDVCIAFSPDGRNIASGGFDNVVRIWESTTGQMLRQLTDHRWPILGVAFSPDGQRLASSSGDCSVRIWDWTTGDVLKVLEPGHSARVQSVAFSRDGMWLASASWDRTIKVWDCATWELLDELSDPSGAALSVAFSDDRRLAWGSTDSTVKVWDGPGTEFQVLRGHSSWVQAVAFSPDGEWIASASLDGTVKIWRTPPSQNDAAPEVEFGEQRFESSSR